MRSSGSSYACRFGDNTSKYLICMKISGGSSYACRVAGCPQPAPRVINSSREFICVPQTTSAGVRMRAQERPRGSSYACFRADLAGVRMRALGHLLGSSYARQGRKADVPKPVTAGVRMRAQHAGRGSSYASLPATRSAAWREFVCVIRRGLAGSLSRASASRSLPTAAAPSLCRRLRSSPVGKPRVPLEEL